MSADTPQVTINDDDQLYRRLHHSWIYPDGTLKRVAYMLNGKPDGEASVDLARLTTPEETAQRGNPGFGVGVISVRVPRALGFRVEYRPLAENPAINQKENLAHCQIEGNNTRVLCKKLAEATTPIIMPREVISPES